MPVLPVPTSGLALGPVPEPTGSGKGALHGIQVMRLAFADTAVLEDVLKHGNDLKFVFGKTGRLVYGDDSTEIVATGQEIRHELYQTGPENEQLDFVGLFSHNLEVRELDESGAVDESLLKLQENYAQIKAEKAASTTNLLDSSELPPARSARRGPLKMAPHMRRGAGAKLGPSRSVSATPSARPSRSPASVLGDVTSSSSNLNAKLDGLRIPLIHLLALGSASEHSLATKTKATEEMCLRILSRIANRVKAGTQWELIDDYYKELNIWNFPYEAQARDKAVTNCRAALNRLKLSRDAPEWQMLLRPEDRGKVDPNPSPTKSSVKVAGPPKTTEPAQSPQVAAGEQPSETGARTPQPQPKAVRSKKDPIGHIIKKKGKKVAAPAKPKGPIGRPRKTDSQKAADSQSKPAPNLNSKIKSAEKIIDSDSEDDIKMSPPKAAPSPLPSPPRLEPAVQSRASSIANSDIEPDRLAVPKSQPKSQPPSKSPKKKPRQYLPTTSSKKPAGYVRVANTPRPAPIKDSAFRRSASNSPPKPSPLGSSPPINASDVEEPPGAPSPQIPTPYAGTSTASQSPSDSLAGVKTSKYGPSMNGVGLKRKAAVTGDDSPQFSDHRSSGSSSSSKRQHTGSPDASTLQLARRFKEEYREYERLYNEARATEDARRKQDKIEHVLRMHQDLEKLKAQIAVQARTPMHVH